MRLMGYELLHQKKYNLLSMKNKYVSNKYQVCIIILL